MPNLGDSLPPDFPPPPPPPPMGVIMDFSMAPQGFSFGATGTSAPDLLIGSSGNDTLNGAGGDDMIIGGPGNDFLIGGAGNDFLDGGPGSNILIGGSGDDVLRVHMGDTAVGGTGMDEFLFAIQPGDHGFVFLPDFNAEEDYYGFESLPGHTQVIANGHTMAIVNPDAGIAEVIVSDGSSFGNYSYFTDDWIGGKG